MHNRVAVVYNEPCASKYQQLGEQKAEDDVLSAVTAVHNALERTGYNVVDVPLALPMQQAKQRLKKLAVDMVFNLFEGFGGYPETEAAIPYALIGLGIPYTGCSGSSIQSTLDKVKTKMILSYAGVATPRYQLLSPDTIAEFKTGYPCIVKPASDDASHGLSPQSVVHDNESLAAQVEKISRIFGGKALVEQFVSGREFNATVLGDSDLTVFPISEICYELPDNLPRILTFESKWKPDSIYFKSTRVACPAELTQAESDLIAATARKAFKVLVDRGYGRVDMRMDADGSLYVLEVNSNPDISPASGAALQAGKAGLSYEKFIEKIIKLARGN